MTRMLSTLIRGSALAALVAMAPVASATGQEAAAPAGDPAAQALIARAATQQSVGAPASMAPPSIEPAPALQPADLIIRAMADAQAEAAEQAALAALEAEAGQLRPGGFVWRPERAPSGRVEMVVSLPQQRIYVYRGGTLIGVSTVSTGRAGHATPTGSFPIIEKRRTHFSNLYNNAPMPNMQRLTMGGIALHAGVIPGYPASHGCVRLPLEFSRLLFGVTSRGERVHIVGRAVPSAGEALAFATGRTPRAGMQTASAR